MTGARGEGTLLIVATEFPPGPGGIGTHAYELARHLSRRGRRVVVLASQDYVSSPEVEAFNAAQPFRVVTWRRTSPAPLRVLTRLASLSALLRETVPVVVVGSGSRAVLACAVACRRARVPWVAIGHGTEFGLRGPRAAALRAAFRRASAVVLVSEYTRRLFDQFDARVPRVEVIPNGADPERFRPMSPDETRAALGEAALPAGRLLITVGNVTRRKAQDIVVRALPAILSRVPDARYVVAGLPTEADAIRRLAAECGVADRVHVTGRLAPEALPAALNAAELFVLTSRRTPSGDVEGYGIAAVEAALCGRAAIVSSGSGLEEAIVDGETGIAVAPEDPGATAAAAVALLTDVDRLRRMGEAARRRALAEQTWERRMDAYAGVLDAVARRAPAASGRESAASAAVP
jgi:phosphatidylinositol alpha-1,6-mannosyltransferase